jgi:fatty acid desaturase
MSSAAYLEPAGPATVQPRVDRLELLFLALAPLGVLLLALRWPSGHPVVLGLITAGLAYVLLCWTSYFHEITHGVLVGQAKTWNRFWGRVIGMLAVVPPRGYRETHIRHHAYLNTPSDWELWPYSDPNRSRAFRRVFVWLDLLFGPLTHMWIYGRIYFLRNSPLSAAARRTIRNEYLLSLAFWAPALSVIGFYGWWPEFLLAWVVPVWLAGILQTGRKLTEHLGMANYDPLHGTRTVIGTSWVSRLTAFVNFKIFVHGVHHRHPHVAHNLLEEKLREYEERNPDARYPVYGSYWQATWAMLPYLFKNPGCGMNVGAPPPARSNLPAVQDFFSEGRAEVQDVRA